MAAAALSHRTGVSLVESLVAVGLVALLAASVLPVTALVARAEHEHRIRAVAETAARSHLERLRAVPWLARPDGTTVLDTRSRVADDGFAEDGRGLLEAPAAALEGDTPGYVDVPGAADGVVPSPVPLTRRWAVRTCPADPSCRVVVVEVARTRTLAAGEPMARAALARTQGVVCVAGVRP